MKRKKSKIKTKVKKPSGIWERDHLTHKVAMSNLIVKKMFAGQIMPHNTAFTFSDKKDDLKKMGKIAGKCEYIGREGIEFYPQELFLLKKAKSEPAPPDHGCVYVQNIQVTGSKYFIPEDIVELEKKFLFPLVKGKEIDKFRLNYSGIIVPFAYDKTSPKKPHEKNILEEKSPKLLQYFFNHQSVIKAQTDYSDKIRGSNSGEFYGLARVGPYSFADHYVAFRDNSKWCAVVISKNKTFWGENKRMLFQNHAVSICEDKFGNFISENEAHYVCAILNAPIVEKYILNSSDERTFKIRPPVKIPKFLPSNKFHKELSDFSKKAHKDSDMIEKILPKLDDLYLKIL
tara:strand:- start:591 stop:1622 length:1032 start_codon:yes stop_codon:yes gene_type:complete